MFLPTESLDELTSMVVKLFAEVENKNVPIPEFPDHPFQDEYLKVSICCLPMLLICVYVYCFQINLKQSIFLFIVPAILQSGAHKRHKESVCDVPHPRLAEIL